MKHKTKSPKKTSLLRLVFLLSGQASEGEQMLLPKTNVQRCVLYVVAAVKHHSVACVDAHVGNAVYTVGVLEEHKVTGT